MGRRSGSWLVVTFVLCCSLLVTQAEQLKYLDCFEDDEKYEEVSEYHGIASSPQDCVEQCRTQLKPYAALSGGTKCLCGSEEPTEGAVCDIWCSGDSSYSCGGNGSMAIYAVNLHLIGPPEAVIVTNSTPSSLHIKWKPPFSPLRNLKGFKVTALPLQWLTDSSLATPVQWTFSGQTNTAKLENLQPATKYQVTVMATTTDKQEGIGESLEAWTKIDTPTTPASPELLSRAAGTMTVQLHMVPATRGPITAYQVVVVDESLQVEVDVSSLTNFHSATQNNLPYYIAAQFAAENFRSMFTVGDGKTYGNYFNAPLRAGVDYHILLGVISSFKDETKRTYSASTHDQHESSELHHQFVRAEAEKPLKEVMEVQLARNKKVILGLSISIGLFGFLLVVSVVVYVALRVMVVRRRRSSDSRDLALAMQAQRLNNEDTENGYPVYTQPVEEEDVLPAEYYRQLKEKVHIIPHKGLHIVGDIGVGKFGDVRKGIVIQKGGQTNVLVHRIEDDALGGSRKTQMLRLFDGHARLGAHPNVTALVGLMEEFSVISLAFEYETATLKSQLVESRAVQHYPVYAEKNRRFSTLMETQALEILAGVARGMAHLASMSVTHGQLCARNVAMVDGTCPKISGFGLIHYHNDLYVPDYRRWQSVETLRSKTSTTRTDVWSFGCLVWEVCSLGGTPYADVRTEDVAGRVTRGLRLRQPQYVGDELYQLMLNCWQHDPDERPTFPELEAKLQQLAGDSVSMPLLFSLYHSFQYEQYAPHLEFLD